MSALIRNSIVAALTVIIIITACIMLHNNLKEAYPPSIHEKKVAEGIFWFLVAKNIIHDPPGDHSYQCFSVMFPNGTGYIIDVKFTFITNANTKIISKLEGKSIVCGISVEEIESGFRIREVGACQDLLYWGERVSSSIDENNPQHIGPSRYINGELFSGSTFLDIILH